MGSRATSSRTSPSSWARVMLRLQEVSPPGRPPAPSFHWSAPSWLIPNGEGTAPWSSPSPPLSCHCRAVEQGAGGGRCAGVGQSVEALRRDAGGGAQDHREDAAALGHHRVLLRRGGTGPIDFRGAGHGDGHRRRLGAHPARVHVHLQRAHNRRPDPALRPGVRADGRRLTGRENGISGLQRIGAGLAMPVLTMAAAALLETALLRAAKASPRAPNGTSVLWQVPQYALEGMGQVLTTVGQFSFFYSQAPPAMKTVCTALGLLSIAAGEYLSSFLLTAVQWATATGGAPGWIPDDLNEGHLDRFFWMMAGLGCLNLMAFVSCAMRYKSRKA